MKKLLLLLLAVCCFQLTRAQFSVQYDPTVQNKNNIQYFKPKGDLFVGDCIPFYHEGTYYLYWLLDSAHHHALNGLGGHQWTLSTSKDLRVWQHQTIVLGIDEDWEKSICTGSVVYANKQFYAFYATRLINKEGQVNEQLSYAISKDGIHFQKQKPNPFYTYAPGYSKRNFRDPKVIVDEKGLFHLFVSSTSDSAMNRNDGAMVHLESADLKTWSVKPPIIANQKDVPECPDYFKWGSWYYLVYGLGTNTYYLKSKAAYGPWEFPSSQVLDEEWNNVVKTAAFTNGRRISAGWIPSKRDNKDNGHEIFGGNIVLRELSQEKDGTLTAAFPKETSPTVGAGLPLNIKADSLTSQKGNQFTINAPNGMGSFRIDQLPLNYRLTCTMEMQSGNIEDFGFYLRGTDKDKMGYKLSFSPDKQTVRLHNTEIASVGFLNKKVTVEIILKDDIIDVCVAGKRTVVNRLQESKGDQLWVFSTHGKIEVGSLKLEPLTDQWK